LMKPPGRLIPPALARLIMLAPKLSTASKDYLEQS